MRYWLMKSEPDVYSIDDLARDGSTFWEGVRNYQARNFMRDDMQVGDRVLFYHSNAMPTGVAGVATLHRTAYPDDTAWDPKNHYFDASCPPGEPRWLRVDVAFEAKLPAVVTLDALKANPALEGMLVTKRGQRLSVQPVSEAHFAEVLRMAGVAFVATP
jgi:predicted RNA-binding protein with PUA-like domain